MYNEKIPKIIHLMWFGSDPYPPLINKCLQSWRDIVPDYTVKLWNIEMIRNLDYRYLKDALKVGKYAFACDVVRAYALYTEGGIYMDSDVFLKRRFDEFINHDFVTFIDTPENGRYDKGQVDNEGNRKEGVKAVCGLGVDITFMASVKGHPYMATVLDDYKMRRFIRDDGTLTMDELIGPDIYALHAESFGFKYKNQTQMLSDDMVVYESKLYNSFNKKAFAVHCCAHSWAKMSFMDKCKTMTKKILSFVNLYKKDYRHLKYDVEINEITSRCPRA